MAAKVYTHPEEVGDPPEIDWSRENREGKSIDEVLLPETEWEDRLKAWCKANGSGKLAGEEVRWGRGDGYARYVVLTERPLALIHIPTGDAWDMDAIFIRGLLLADIRENVRQQQAMAELFGRSKVEKNG